MSYISGWRDLNDRPDHTSERQQILDNLFTAVKLQRPSEVSELTMDPTTQPLRKVQKKKTTIKQLFSVASKFQKHLKR